MVSILTSLKLNSPSSRPHTLQDRACPLYPDTQRLQPPSPSLPTAFRCFGQPKALDFLIHHLRFFPLVSFSLPPIYSAMSPYLNFVYPSWPNCSAISCMKPPPAPQLEMTFSSCELLGQSVNTSLVDFITYYPEH